MSDHPSGMRIVCERPPNFDEIDARFNIAGRYVIFAWGSIIYNPMSVDIPPQLMFHEAVHGRRQGTDIEGWWRRYIDDPKFRLAEEIPAHCAEYAYLAGRSVNRNQRRQALKITAKRLASPLYGRMTTRAAAAKALKKEACSSSG